MAHAQFERPALTAAMAPLEIRPDGEWRGSLGAGFSATSGNTNSLGGNLSLDAVRATDSNKLTVFGQALYSQNRKDGVTVKTADQWRLGGRHDWGRKDSAAYVFGSASAESDAMRQLDLRATVGTGIGYRVVREADLSFEVFGGVGYRGDRYLPPGSTVDGQLVDSYDAMELTLGEESAARLSSNTTWLQRLMLFPNLSDGREYRAVFETVLAVAMTRHLNLTVSLVDRYDSQAVSPLRHNDLLFFTGVNLRYGAR